VRELAPTVPLLIPGVGAQGGDATATVKAGYREQAGRITGLVVVNVGRSVLYASRGPDFAEAARRAAMAMRGELNAARR
jgi:orotidine-5'-phosphate decarboxylase